MLARLVCPAETPHGPFCGPDYMLRQVTWLRACAEFPASQHVNQATDGPSIPVSLKLPLLCLYFVRNWAIKMACTCSCVWSRSPRPVRPTGRIEPAPPEP